jgi:hypothetical protein
LPKELTAVIGIVAIAYAVLYNIARRAILDTVLLTG